jgi:predicted glycosyltransferase
MNIAVYLGHPSHYYFFKHPIRMWVKKGNRVQVVIRTKDILEDLLVHDDVHYVNILPEGRSRGSIAIFYALLKRIVRLYFQMRHFHPDILIGSDASLPIVARILQARSITTLEDDYDVVKSLAMLTYPFTNVILTPFVCQVGKWENKKVGYNGYMKLSALHPNRFSIDPQTINSTVGNDPYCLVRLSALNAYHDKGIHGLSLEVVHKIISKCEQYGLKVWINSETTLCPALVSYQLHIHPAQIHHILAGATLLISDSQSMSVEASVLGVPSIRYSDFTGKISVLEELEHTYQLTKGIPPNSSELLLNQIEEWLSTDSLHDIFQSRKEKMLEDKMDVALFVAWFVEDYCATHAMHDACNRFILANQLSAQ